MNVSVIIPAYNAGKYIGRCIESILFQSHSALEIICVDDCSTDNTAEILSSCEKIDSRIKVFQTASNSGCAKVPRDLGISKAQGDYIVCIDADDYIENKFLEKLVHRQKETNADVVMGKIFFFGCNESLVSIPKDDFDFSRIMTGREAVMLTVGDWKIGASGCLATTGLVKSQRAQSAVKPNLMNADEYDTRDLLIKAKTTAFADAGYFYRRHTESITKNFSRQFECLETDKSLLDLFSKNFGKTSKEYHAMLMHYILSIKYYARLFKSGRRNFNSDEEKNKAYEIIRRAYGTLGLKEIMTSRCRFIDKLRLLSNFNLYLKSL